MTLWICLSIHLCLLNFQVHKILRKLVSCLSCAMLWDFYFLIKPITFKKSNIIAENREIKIFCMSSNVHGLILTNHSQKYPFWHLITKDVTYKKWTIEKYCLCSPGSRVILNSHPLSSHKVHQTILWDRSVSQVRTLSSFCFTKLQSQLTLRFLNGWLCSP